MREQEEDEATCKWAGDRPRLPDWATFSPIGLLGGRTLDFSDSTAHFGPLEWIAGVLDSWATRILANFHLLLSGLRGKNRATLSLVSFVHPTRADSTRLDATCDEQNWFTTIRRRSRTFIRATSVARNRAIAGGPFVDGTRSTAYKMMTIIKTTILLIRVERCSRRVAIVPQCRRNQ